MVGVELTFMAATLYDLCVLHEIHLWCRWILGMRCGFKVMTVISPKHHLVKILKFYANMLFSSFIALYSHFI